MFEPGVKVNKFKMLKSYIVENCGKYYQGNKYIKKIYQGV